MAEADLLPYMVSPARVEFFGDGWTPAFGVQFSFFACLGRGDGGWDLMGVKDEGESVSGWKVCDFGCGMGKACVGYGCGFVA